MKNEILELKELESQLDEINKSLIAEKRKVRKESYGKLKRKTIKKLKVIRRLAIQKLKAYPNIYLIDKTAISIVSVNRHKRRYWLNHRLNLCIAYNFSLGYGFAVMDNLNQITKGNVNTLLAYIKPNCDNPILLTDNRHKYANSVEKAISQTIERLFAQIKNPIYTQLKNNEIKTFSQLFNVYKLRLKEFNIIPINF
jgi:hypothetical protein